MSKENLPKASDQIDRRFYQLPDGKLSAVHYNADKGPLKLVMVNANGFNGLSYRQLLEPLGVHSAALDLRGHGKSELPVNVKGLKNWNIFRDDVVFFINHCAPGPVILAGHSFGGTSAVMTAPFIRQKLAGYVGFDPVFMPKSISLWPYLPGGRTIMCRYIPEARQAGRRRFVFPSKEAVFERYQGRGVFKSMPDIVLGDYLEGGLKPHREGVQLAAHPKWEQAIFTAQGNNPFKAAKFLPENSLIIFAGKDPISSLSSRRKMTKIVGADTIVWRKDFRHLFPLIQSDSARPFLEQIISKAKF